MEAKVPEKPNTSRHVQITAYFKNIEISKMFLEVTVTKFQVEVTYRSKNVYIQKQKTKR